ncbi:ATP-binding protein [Anatilimnocola sp. NA78]|uniref:hybrid sensor histidine kinase/response regulator n=1 Tax=Anatilimnocola sp. NA78 TaxID=3415683 RepID=UPI003CE557BF
MTPPVPSPVYFLLVDDLSENLIALEALLRRDGLVTLQARSGAEALEMLLAHDVALAFIDVQMPGMDGFELAELMRGTERTRRVPIIFVTAGSADWGRRFRGYEAGAVDFLLKPIEADILRSKADVFFDLALQRQELLRQRDELKAVSEQNAKLLQESRQYAAALKETDRRKDEFLATLAHELRNPLAPLLNGIQLLGMEQPASPELQEIHDVLERQVRHMIRLVDDLLDVSRITSGKIELQLEKVRLQEIVQSAVETSRPLIESAKHQLTIHVPPAPLVVSGDAVRLTQILANLLNNAAKYTPDGGKIVVIAEQQENWALLRVRDNGLGIPAGKLDEVFQMFSQLDKNPHRSQGGLGIGLSLVKRLVEMHRGTVHVTSAGENKGAEFVVRLPIVMT